MTYEDSFTCPICGFHTWYVPHVAPHWRLHQNDPQELRDLLAKLAESKKEGGGK